MVYKYKFHDVVHHRKGINTICQQNKNKSDRCHIIYFTTNKSDRCHKLKKGTWDGRIPEIISIKT